MIGALSGAAVVLGTRVADAHFVLQAPDAMYQQGAGDGLPEKSAPCGQADSGGPVAVATNIVDTFTEGQQITVTINEVVTHPGHYRVALAASMSALPADPLASNATACSQATVESTPTLPVIADNQLVHTSAFSGPQSFMVTLPAGFTCTNCVLQVIELMTDHTPSTNCFYHHCATLTIKAPSTTGSAGSAGGGSAGTTGTGGAVGSAGAGGRGATGGAGGAPVTGAAGASAVGSAGASGAGAAGTTGTSTGNGGTTGAAGTGTGSAGSGSGAGGSGTGSAGSGAAGSGTGAAGSTGTGGDTGGGSGGGGCSTAAGRLPGTPWALLLAAAVLVIRRRRRG
jgi:hypothetical protein